LSQYDLACEAKKEKQGGTHVVLGLRVRFGQERPSCILTEDVDGVVDLDVHVVENLVELLALGRDDLARLFRLDLVASCSSLPVDESLDDDVVAVDVVVVGLEALVLEGDRHSAGTGK
jgi:hypothetical protein